MKFKFLLFLTPLILLSSCSNDVSEYQVINKRPLYTHEFFQGEIDISDSIMIPQEYYLELDLVNIRVLKQIKKFID